MSSTRIKVAPDQGTEHPAIEKIREELGAIEMDVLTSFTLADAIREGSAVTSKQEGGWVESTSACSLGAGFLSAKARGYLP